MLAVGVRCKVQGLFRGLIGSVAVLPPLSHCAVCCPQAWRQTTSATRLLRHPLDAALRAELAAGLPVFWPGYPSAVCEPVGGCVDKV
jgi:hypothetical protein